MHKKPHFSPDASQTIDSVRALMRPTLIVAAYLCAFTILDYLTLAFKEYPGVVTWYPPAGLSFALLLVFGARFVPAIMIASLISSLFIYRLQNPPEFLLLWAIIISSVYGAAAAFLRRRQRFDWHLPTLRDVSVFVFATVLIAAVLATFAIWGSVITGVIPSTEFSRALFHWWIGETVGVLTVTPFLLIHVIPALQRFAEGSPIREHGLPFLTHPTFSTIAQGAMFVGTLYWVFGSRVLGEFQPLYLIILPLMWVALRRGLKGVTVGIVALNFGVLFMVWYFQFDLSRLSEVQLLMIVNCIVGLFLGAVVSERKLAEESLASERTLLSTLINTIPDFVYVKDTESRFILNNAAHIQALGAQTQAEVIGKTDHDFIHAKLAAGYITDDQHVVSSGEAIYNREEKMVLPNGDHGTILSSKVPFRNSSGEVTGLVGVSRDITERKVTEQLVLDMQRRESIGILAGGIAHDFNNLLGSMMGNISLAQAQLPSDHPAVVKIEKALLAMDRAANLTKQMLAYSGKGRFESRTIDIADMINEHVSLFTVSLPKNVKLVTQFPATPVLITGDPGQIEQIIMNLIINGGEAIGDKQGAVTIILAVMTMGHDELAPYSRVTNATLSEGPYAVLELSDNGMGMSKETQTRIFDPFFTTKFTGRGLGLSAVLGIIRGHGGGIYIDSIEGAGTTFHIVLPALPPAT